METQEQSLIKIVLITMMLLIGIFGNCLNLKIFSSKRMKKISTFRYLSYLAMIDMIILILWSIYNLITLAKLETHSYLMYKIITFLSNYLSQMNSWIFVASNVNKARLMVNESKNKKSNENKSQNSISLHTKIIISIGIFLFLLNFHYLIYYDLIKSTNDSSKIDLEILNKTHHFVHNLIVKSNHNNNYTKNQTKLIMNIISLKNISLQTDQTIIEHKLKDYDYMIFLNKIWFWIRLILFSIIPFIINSTSAVIINQINRNSITNPKRKKFNNQFISLFIFSNLFIFLITLTYYVNVINYRLKEYELELNFIQLFAQIVLNLKHSFSFLVYWFVLRIYKREFFKLFALNEKNERIETIRNNIEIGERLPNESVSLKDDNVDTKKKNRTKSVRFSLENEKNEEDYFNSAEPNITWIGSDFFKHNSEFRNV